MSIYLNLSQNQENRREKRVIFCYLRRIPRSRTTTWHNRHQRYIFLRKYNPWDCQSWDLQRAISFWVGHFAWMSRLHRYLCYLIHLKHFSINFYNIFKLIRDIPFCSILDPVTTTAIIQQIRTLIRNILIFIIWNYKQSAFSESS